jgi:hypothetical protein
VCSVRSLHRAIPPPDPPVYIRLQLKPPCGICSFTTTTFGAHRGADQGAGRSTSGRDLLCLLGGSTSASPPSTAGLLYLPRLPSTRPGQHSVIPDLHQHLRASTRPPRAGIFMSRPTYVGLGSTPAFPRPAYMFPDRNIRLRAGIYRFWLFLAGISSSWAGLALSRPVLGALGPGWAGAPAQQQVLAGPTRFAPGWAGSLIRLKRIYNF